MPPPGLPIIWYVAAGTPILAVETLEGAPEIHRLIEERSNLLVLLLKETAWWTVIEDGDDVIVRAQPGFEPGDAGGVMIVQEVTVKTIRLRTR